MLAGVLTMMLALGGLIALLSGALQWQLTSFFARNSRVVNIIGGVLLIGVAIYDLSLNWDILRLFLPECLHQELRS